MTLSFLRPGISTRSVPCRRKEEERRSACRLRRGPEPRTGCTPRMLTTCLKTTSTQTKIHNNALSVIYLGTVKEGHQAEDAEPKPDVRNQHVPPNPRLVAVKQDKLKRKNAAQVHSCARNATKGACNAVGSQCWTGPASFSISDGLGGTFVHPRARPPGGARGSFPARLHPRSTA